MREPDSLIGCHQALVPFYQDQLLQFGERLDAFLAELFRAFGTYAVKPVVH